MTAYEAVITLDFDLSYPTKERVKAKLLELLEQDMIEFHINEMRLEW